MYKLFAINIMGKKFGRLTVIKRDSTNKWGNAMWLCKCECGEEKVITSGSLRRGYTKSCGCLQKEITSKRSKMDLGLANLRALLRSYKNNAKRRGLKFKLTEEQFREITQKDYHYCGAKPNNKSGHEVYNGNYVYNGLDRVDNNKGYIIDNIVACCKTCNHAKGILSLQEFQDWVKRIYRNIEVVV